MRHFDHQIPAAPSTLALHVCKALTSQTGCARILVNRKADASIPNGLWPYVQKYDPPQLDREHDADLIIPLRLDHRRTAGKKCLWGRSGAAQKRTLSSQTLVGSSSSSF